ncbi:MAG: formate dehydrogenase accessory sulfurtransferase FdhD [Comamonas sp.]
MQSPTSSAPLHLQDDGTPAAPSLRAGPVEVLTADGVERRDDWIAAEVPVALVFNGLSHAVMMATPQDLAAFALGFALSEGILDSLADCYGIEVQPGCDDAVEVHLEIASQHFARLKDRRRSLAGRTGCGVCGIDSLQALDLEPQPLTPPAWVQKITLTTLAQAFAELPAHQPLNRQAGAIHAAAWARLDGSIAVAMEDVGRHNALDKLLGHMAQQQLLGTPGFVAMTSRASYELVRKCARLGLPVLATISAPTTLAIQIAQQAHLQLYGLCRGSRAIRYAG